MNDEAMDYEYLVRRAFQCGRFGVVDANADNYRGLESAEAVMIEIGLYLQ